MSVPAEIDELIAVLRSPARPCELADETSTIDAMADAFKSSEGMSTMKKTSRRARVGVLIATGIIGFGGVAAAGPGGVFDSGEIADEVETTTAPEPVVESESTVAISVEVTTTVAETVPEETTTTVATPEEAPLEVLAVEGELEPVIDDPDTLFDEAECLEGNHGKTVSAVAREELVLPDIEVRDAAHSSCGKQGSETEPEVVEPEETANELDEPNQGRGSATEKPGNGNGNGQGKGKGRGQGD
jgi:hypothetical protein